MYLPRTTCREPLGRTTEGPVRMREDSPCEIVFSVTTLWSYLAAISRGSPRDIISPVETLKTALAPISRGKCSGLPATLWSNLSVETTHLSRGSYSTGKPTGVSGWYGVYPIRKARSTRSNSSASSICGS